ncbi:MAG: hypothetical protein OEU86_08715 [Gammaproteobacteria bacterium]|nr:hypothetical protein [Gammaproteobacteria bacterium]
MALKKCDECNTLMSDKAPNCLNCGYPIAGRSHASSHPLSGKTQAKPKLLEYATLASVLILIALVITQ